MLLENLEFVVFLVTLYLTSDAIKYSHSGLQRATSYLQTERGLGMQRDFFFLMRIRGLFHAKAQGKRRTGRRTRVDQDLNTHLCLN